MTDITRYRSLEDLFLEIASRLRQVTTNQMFVHYSMGIELEPHNERSKC